MWFAQTICFALKLVIKYCNLDDFKKQTHTHTHAHTYTYTRAVPNLHHCHCIIYFPKQTNKPKPKNIEKSDCCLMHP